MKTKTVYITSDGQEFEAHHAAKRHEDELTHTSKNKRRRFMIGMSGKRLSEQHSLGDYGVWRIVGEPPNPYSHHNPYLATVEGILSDVIDYAVKQDGFFTWGNGGDINKVDIIKLDEF